MDAVSAVADNLREARALIERGWTQNMFARANKRRVHVMSPSARTFCIVGALMRVRQTPSCVDVTDEMRALRFATSQDNLATWNDAPERTHAEVLEALDKAIALAESDQ